MRYKFFLREPNCLPIFLYSYPDPREEFPVSDDKYNQIDEYCKCYDREESDFCEIHHPCPEEILMEQEEAESCHENIFHQDAPVEVTPMEAYSSM